MNISELILQEMNVPITLCHVNCHNCHMPIDFNMFESGPGGDFKTVYGKTTKRYYRIDLTNLYYSKRNINDVITKIIETEGNEDNIMEFPEELECAFCKTINKGNDQIMVDKEQIIKALLI